MIQRAIVVTLFTAALSSCVSSVVGGSVLGIEKLECPEPGASVSFILNDTLEASVSYWWDTGAELVPEVLEVRALALVQRGSFFAGVGWVWSSGKESGSFSPVGSLVTMDDLQGITAEVGVRLLWSEAWAIRTSAQYSHVHNRYGWQGHCYLGRVGLELRF